MNYQAMLDRLEERSSAPAPAPHDTDDPRRERITTLFVDGRPGPGAWARACEASLQRAQVARAVVVERRRARRLGTLLGLGLVAIVAAGLWLALGDGGPLGSFAGI